jgi:membrane-bound lytic murein transglycosylase D
MNVKHTTLALVSFFSFSLSAQESVQSESFLKPVSKISFLDSIKATFVHDAMASCVDSLWLKELTSLDLYNNITSDIRNINLDQKVDYELPTELLKERLKKLDAKSPFNIEYNPGLENIIKSFLKTRKRSYERLMAISEYYFPMFEEALARQNVPLEIKYLAIVESALNPKAVSRMGATGLWQFMYQTGKQYNLHIDSYVDERSDPLKASEAAAQYMSNMYRIFGDWDLVLASYNSGPGNVAKAIRRSGGHQNYWNIRKHLPQETQGYVPAFLATMYIYEYHKEHGIVPDRALVKHFQTDTVMVKRQLSFKQISDLLDIPVAQLEMLNPSYKLKTVPSYANKLHFLRLPQDKAALFSANESKVYAYAAYQESLREKPFSSQQAYASRDSARTSGDMVSVTRTKLHKVRKGENLSAIASRYGVSVAQVKKWNGIKGSTVPTGQTLKITTTEMVAQKAKKEKSPAAKPSESIAAAEPKISQESVSETVASAYVVQPGDNLSAIARKHNLTVTELKELNNIEENTVHAGTRLVVAKTEVAVSEPAKPEYRNLEYEVKKGEFLGFIAKKHNISLEEIREWNGLTDNNVCAGMKLIVGKTEVASADQAIAEAQPKKDKVQASVKESTQHYMVRKGDSLFSIAKQYPGVTIADIKKWNGIKNESIKPGMKLKING